MNTLLEVRFDTLLAALHEVVEIIEFWERRRREPRELAEALGIVRRHLDEASRAFGSAMEEMAWTDAKLAQSKDPVGKEMNTLRVALDLMEAQLDAARATAAKFESRLDRIPDDKLRFTINQDLVKDASELKGRVEQLKQDAEGADAKALEGIWETLTGQIEEKCRNLFSVFNDILGGVALRVSGLDGLALRPHRTDGSISSLAEELVTHQWKGVTLPTSFELAAGGHTSVLRLGFPEWTIWDLPYAAHSWASATAELISGEIERAAAAELDVETLGHVTGPTLSLFLADALATYLMGPSYACATFLRLNPLPKTSDEVSHETTSGEVKGGEPRRISPLDHERAWVINEMLIRLSSEAPKGAFTFIPIAESINRSWLEASVGDVDDLEEGVEQELKAIINALIEYLDSPATNITRYGLDSWSKVNEWCESVEAGKPPAVDSRDLRDFLNFAWQCRMEGCLATPAQIEREALGLWAQGVTPPDEAETESTATRKFDLKARLKGRI